MVIRLFPCWMFVFICICSASNPTFTIDSATVGASNADTLRSVTSTHVTSVLDSTSAIKIHDTADIGPQSDTLFAQPLSLVDSSLAGIVDTAVLHPVVKSNTVACKKNRYFGVLYLMLLIVLVLVLIVLLMVRSRQQNKLYQRQFMTTTRLSIMDKEIQIACRYIEKNYAVSSLTPETICTAIVTGRAFLEMLFEREMGMSVSAFVKYVRINNAKAILEQNPHITVEELAHATGFENNKDFEEAFKAIVHAGYEEFAKRFLER